MSSERAFAYSSLDKHGASFASPKEVFNGQTNIESRNRMGGSRQVNLCGVKEKTRPGFVPDRVPEPMPAPTPEPYVAPTPEPQVSARDARWEAGRANFDQTR
jgi:hypothetical protein